MHCKSQTGEVIYSKKTKMLGYGTSTKSLVTCSELGVW